MIAHKDRTPATAEDCFVALDLLLRRVHVGTSAQEAEAFAALGKIKADFVRAADRIRITCQSCHGSGVTTVRHPTGDPQLETIGECPELKCVDGRIEMTDEEVEELVLASRFALLTAGSITGITAGAERRLHRALIPAGLVS